MNAPDRPAGRMAEDEPCSRRSYLIYKPSGDWATERYFSEAQAHGFSRDIRLSGNTGTKVQPADNLDERFESFILADGQKKIEIEHETRVPNAAMFTFNKEDHTLGNLIKDKLHKTEHVIFAGYIVPHPLNAMFRLRIQTDGQITPKDVLKQACRELIKELEMFDQDFTKEFELKKIATAGTGL